MILRSFYRLTITTVLRSSCFNDEVEGYACYDIGRDSRQKRCDHRTHLLSAGGFAATSIVHENFWQGNILTDGLHFSTTARQIFRRDD